jgi:hypothetical protein
VGQGSAHPTSPPTSSEGRQTSGRERCRSSSTASGHKRTAEQWPCSLRIRAHSCALSTKIQSQHDPRPHGACPRPQTPCIRWRHIPPHLQQNVQSCLQDIRTVQRYDIPQADDQFIHRNSSDLFQTRNTLGPRRAESQHAETDRRWR